MSGPTPRQQIEEWAAAHAEGSPRGVAIVRAALEIIDESHAPRVCGPGPCQFQVEHERKLLEAINGRES